MFPFCDPLISNLRLRFARFTMVSIPLLLCSLLTLVGPIRLSALAERISPKPGAFGGFASAPTYSVSVIDPTVDSISSLAAADLNGDGKADAVVGLTDGIAVLLNDGSGHLTAASTISLVASPATLANSFQHVLVAIGDVNGDGKPDIAATVNGQVWVMLNKGDGTFTAPPTPYSPGLVFSMAIGDVTGDGKPDIVLLLGASVNVMQGNGDGAFTPIVGLSNRTGNFYLPIQQYWGGIIGDINGDGKPDLVASGNLECGVNPTTGQTLQCGNPFALTVEDNTGSGQFAEADVLYPYGPYGSIALADVNHDGLPDIVLGTNNVDSSVNWVAVAINKGPGLSPLGIQFPSGPQFSDPEVITAIYSGLEDSSLPAPLPITPGTGEPLNAFGLSVMAIDFNGDGYPDLIVNDNNNGALFSLQNNQDSTFTTVAAVPGGLGMSPLAMADFNGDGTPDVLVANAGTNTVSVLLGKGGGILVAATSFPVLTTPGSTSEVLNNGNAIADFNGDGVPDYVYSDSNGNMHEQISTASGYKSTNNVLAVSPLGGSTNPVQVILAADFNGDGRQDLLLQYGGYESGTSFLSATFGVALGNGDGTFVVPSVLNSYTYSLGNFIVADLNKDGKPDVLAHASFCTPSNVPGGSACLGGSTANWVVAFLGRGDGTFQAGMSTETEVAGDGEALAVGDVTGDGIPDLIVSGDSGLSVWQGSGSGSFFEPQLITKTSPGAPVIGDLNGDGANDIATSNGSEVTTLLNDGKGNFPASLSSVVPNSAGSNLHAVDANNDGLTDLLILSAGSSPCWLVSQSCGQGGSDGPSSVQTLLSNGDGTFKSSFLPINDPFATYGAFQILDVNGDGAPDIVVATANELTSIYYNLTGSAVTLSPGSLAYPAQNVGTASTSQIVTLTNSGTAALSIASIAASGDFAETNNCGNSLAVAASCAIAVTFTPTAAGTRSGNLTVSDDASNSPQTVSLMGTGTSQITTAPAVTLSPTNLTFASQADGSTSAAQSVTLTNSGSAPLAITSIAASGEFAQTNTCGTSVAAGANCVISVTFTPTSTGSGTGSLTITDNASGSPQTVSLNGTGATVAVSTSSSSLTIASTGGSTSAAIAITPPSGFSGTVNLTCALKYLGQGTASDAPTCSLSPAQASITNGAAASTTLTVATTAATAASDFPQKWRKAGGVLAAMLFLIWVPRRQRRGMTMLVLLCFCLLSIGGVMGCSGNSGGSGGGSTPPPNSGTTTGSYSVTVTATSGTLSSSTTIPLSVQ